MADVTLVQSGSNNGTTTPASPGSLTTTAGNLLILIIGVAGTSPTIATPASWTQVQKVQGGSTSFAMYAFPNNTGGATNPSSTLGGTVTGWVSSMFEFNQCGSNCGLQGSLIQSPGTSTIPNIFANQIGQMPPQMLFFYSLFWNGGQTLTPQNTGLAPINQSGVLVGGSSWQGPVQSQANVQGMSMQSFWGTNLAQGVGPWPGAAGILSSNISNREIAAWFNTTASNAQVGALVGGNEGIYVPTFYQGMVGG
jgi:hypothetical protein